MPKKLPFAASALALAVSSAFAQSSALTATQTTSQYQLAYLDPVVVTASRFEQNLADVPAFAQVITKEEISGSGVTSVSEAVNKIGNINVRSLAGGPFGILADIDMRGFGASARDNTLILVDGMRVSPIDSGSISWELIPISNVERIEIIHGGGSVQFGDKAVGGVINIITRGDLTRPSTAAVTFGSYGTVMTNASLITGWDSTRMKLDVVADSTDGWRENSQSRQGMAKGLLSHSLGGQDKIFAEILTSHQDYRFPGAVVGEVGTGNPRAAKFNNVGDKTSTDSARGLAGAAKSFGEGWQLLAEVAYSDTRAKQTRPYYANDGDPATVGQILYNKQSFDLTPRLRKIWGTQGESIIGLDYQKANAIYDVETGDKQKGTVDNRAVYFSHRQFITSQFDISGGARRQIQRANAFDRFTDWYGSGTTAETTYLKRQGANAADLAMAYRFGNVPENKIFFRSNRSYRFANTDEYWGCDYQGYDCIRKFVGILRPQETNTIEIGGSVLMYSKTTLSGTIFRADSTDEIRYRYADYTNINAPKIRRDGVSLLLRYAPSQRFTLQSSLTWQKSEYLEGDNSGKEVPLVPRTVAALGATYKNSDLLTYRVYVSYVGSQRYMDDDDNTKNRMPSYALVDLGLRYQKSRWELDAFVKNATDKKYANYGGYSSFLSTSPGVYSTGSYFYYPGDPRTFWLSARYRFN